MSDWAPHKWAILIAAVRSAAGLHHLYSPSVATWGRALFKITPQGISHSLNQFSNLPASFTLTEISKGRRSAGHMKQIQFKPFLTAVLAAFYSVLAWQAFFEFPCRHFQYLFFPVNLNRNIFATFWIQSQLLSI